jgi:NADH-quinone oxidoreductase subunit L
VGFLIHLYSARFMAEDEGVSRFFAWMNLFVASMLILVLADDLVVLYLGWEGVGLSSYLLIGFWYKDRANGRAAMKAFIVTRVGDAALAVGLFLISTTLGTLQIQEIGTRALQQWPVGSGVAVAAALLLLAGAVGKSAQLPLQTWLPDAMAGPTPVSALIHAATMVTAGVYLIARMHVVFSLAPGVMTLVAILGAATMLLAGCSALTQRDIKRVLAYSTMSQIGYMFLALGVGAYSAAVFHFVTHAFFKSLLFLAAGVVILGLGGEHDMFQMGGLRRKLPKTFWVFLIGALALSAAPPTAGFASKDLILLEAWGSESGGAWLLAAGLAGALLTSMYTFRMVFLTFFGPAKTEPGEPVNDAGVVMGIPLAVLALGCVFAGLLNFPAALGGSPMLVDFLKGTLGTAPGAHAAPHVEMALTAVSVFISLLGIVIAWALYVVRPELVRGLVRTSVGSVVRGLWFDGWGFDRLYDVCVVRPFTWAARVNRRDVVDYLYRGIAWVGVMFHVALSRTETGEVRWYVAGVAFGAVILVAILVWL